MDVDVGDEVVGDDAEFASMSWAIMSLYAFATFSASPETVRTLSLTPGMTLLTPALTPVCSRAQQHSCHPFR